MGPGVTGEPIDPWIMETGSILFWCALAAASALAAMRTRRLSLLALCLIAATASFPQEFFGDWGAYVAWNPHFARLPFWGDMPYTTPVKPVFIPFSWGWSFGASLPLLVSLVAWLGRKLPRVSTTLLSFLIVFPFFTAYDLSGESGAIAKGWWTYDTILGPTVTSGGGHIPVVFPVLLGLWAAGFVALLARRDAAGFWRHERALGVDRVTPGGRLQLARAGAFILLFEVSFFLVNIAPPILGRLLAGGPSVLVP